MANRSLFPESTEVHARHLTTESAFKTDEDRRVVNTSTTKGVYSGLAVTVNSSNNTRIDVAAGGGYCPNGDAVVVTVPQSGLNLADYTLGVKNYVLAVYDELQSLPEAHETDGTTRNTRATVNPRMVVLTESAYNALPSSSIILSNNAKDRALVCAIVTANGVGIGLTNGSITSPTLFKNSFQSNQPAAITGVQIITIDSNTTPGTGTLSFNAGTKQLTWQAPGEGSPGSTITFTTSGAYAVTSSGGKTLLLNVSLS